MNQKSSISTGFAKKSRAASGISKLDEVSAHLTTAGLRTLNARMSADEHAVGPIATAWLEDGSLVILDDRRPPAETDRDVLSGRGRELRMTRDALRGRHECARPVLCLRVTAREQGCRNANTNDSQPHDSPSFFGGRGGRDGGVMSSPSGCGSARRGRPCAPRRPSPPAPGSPSG